MEEDLEYVMNLLEKKYKRKLALYEKLGKNCPSFASFEIAANENKGAKILPNNIYQIYNIEKLNQAWTENMALLTKRKISETHWQAGLKKWLDGQWRKDKRPFELVLKEQKVVEANTIRNIISQLVSVKNEIKEVVKAPQVVHHHHHYYCKCGEPVVKKEEIKKEGEIHHVHMLAETPTVALDVASPMEQSITIKSEMTNPGDDMDCEVINKSVKVKKEKRKRIGKRGGESPKQKRNKHKNSYKQYGSPYESSSEHSSIQSIELPMDYQSSPVQYLPQEEMQFYPGHMTQQQFVPTWQPELFPGNIQLPPFQIPQVQDIFNEVQFTPIQPEYFINQFTESFKNVTNYMFNR
jgi:hypothetical protein